MPNYKQSQVSGNAWVRAKSVIIENPLNRTAAISFIKEKVVVVDGSDVLSAEAGACRDQLTPDNMNEQFDLIHPETGAVLGTATYGQVYAMLSSLFIHVDIKDEARAAALRAQIEANLAPPPPDTDVSSLPVPAAPTVN